MVDVARVSTLAKMDLGNARGGTGFGESVSMSISIFTMAKTSGAVLSVVDACKELGIISVSVELDCWMVKGFTVLVEKKISPSFASFH